MLSSEVTQSLNSYGHLPSSGSLSGTAMLDFLGKANTRPRTGRHGKVDPCWGQFFTLFLASPTGAHVLLYAVRMPGMCSLRIWGDTAGP